uniref:Metalloendopeptidase n=1 Tax=Angiostrongylus cantonensis TaxID=6313 RepID=A0A0K0D7G0_ANGCA
MEIHIVQHELLHVIGLWHEHMRYDRDQYVRVLRQNIAPGYESQFKKISSSESTVYGLPYDYRSIMHYSKTAFAIPGTITMETRDPRYMNVIGRQNDASRSDYLKVCQIYGCNQCNGEECVDKFPKLCVAVKQYGLLDCNGNDERYCCATCKTLTQRERVDPFDSSYSDYYDDY